MKRSLITLLAGLLSLSAIAIEIPGKQIYIPKELQDNNFESDTARWSYHRMSLTENFVIFWERGFGDDLQNPPRLEGRPMSIDLKNLEQKLERFYRFYRDTLHFIGPGSNAEKYRMMVMLNYSLEGTAYGGDYDEFIGAFWVAPNRLQDKTLNCVAHELGHSFQMQVHCDKKSQAGRPSTATDQFIDTQDAEQPEQGRWFGGGFFEMTSQWMLWHVNPYWVRDEHYHWQAYQHTPHKAFLHWENVYHSPYVLEWWSQNHGLDIIGDIYKNARNPEDPADAFMRLTKMTLGQFSDDLFEANRHTVFLDFTHAREQTRPFVGGFQTTLVDEDFGWHRTTPEAGGNWLRILPGQCPETGGFNAIALQIPSRGQRVAIDFEGLAGSIAAQKTAALPSDTAYHISHPEVAGWRYGFVALLADGTCAYSPIYNKVRGRATFDAPAAQDVRQLYFVVMGAPTNRHPESAQPRRRGRRPAPDAQWPYRIRQR
ncbi:MAG: hypothetical protein K6C30_02215 [Bacteroidaceae bacterium]|nr:hypothetical protein [Bacteroidaceae bacterium]